MDKLRALSLGRQIVLLGSVVLLVDSFFHWQQVDVKVAGIVSISGGQSAWHGFWGIVLGLLLVALVIWIIGRAYGFVPAVVPEGVTTLAAAALVPLLIVIKVIADDYVHWPAYVGLVLGAVIAYGGWLVFGESGEKLPSFQERHSG
jgi:hypothetical protein